jgi:regulator of protease activity HflC (stomatin/prohibitin superfamily)
MNRLLVIGVGLLLVLLFLVFTTSYSVRYHEVAIRQTFGRVDESSVIREAGWHFKLPVFLDRIDKIDTRLQLVESPLEEITTADGLQIVVKAFLLWRVDEQTPQGPLDFFRGYETIDNASSQLGGQFRTAFTGGLSRYRFDDLIGEQSRLAEAEQSIRDTLAQTLATKGIEPVSVGVSQIVFPAATARAVVNRMIATRESVAELERTAGTAEAAQIRNDANIKVDKINSFAINRAEDIRQRGEEKAAEILASMSEDATSEELAILLAHLDALEVALSRLTTVFLPAQVDPWRFILEPPTEPSTSSLPSVEDHLKALAVEEPAKTAEGAGDS